MSRTTYARRVGRGCGVVAALSSIVAFAGCESAPPTPESTSRIESPIFTNGGFEIGVAGTPPGAPWTVATFLNPGVTVQNPQTRAGLNLAPGGNALTTIIAGVNLPDPDLGLGASLRWPRYGAQCGRVNFHSSNAFGNAQNVNALAQTMTIAAGDVDANDNLVHVRFVVAPVLQNPVHAANQQPYYFVQLTNVTQNKILYTDFNLSAQAGVPWKTVNGGTPQEIDYTDWQLVDIAPGNASLGLGDSVKLEIIASGCSLGGHFGTVYVDGVGTVLQGLYVSGTGPAQANAGTNITYTLTYRNGALVPETGVVIDLTTPPGTTFQGITPPAGATCVTPAIGATGTIVCTFSGPVPAGATGMMSVTLGINAGAVGTIVEGNYDIKSNQEGALLGNHIVTKIGCALDTDCTAGNWCNESGAKCTPTLPNGTALPTDAPHVNPALNGMCTAGAGALVCTAGVCDTDNKCGLLNNVGPCTVANGPVRCRSGVCDPDLKCGYAVGDGPCTVGNQGTVCRSGACSTNGNCEPSGGCNVDADCTGGNWCSESTHVCTAKIANGTTLPNDPPHTGPTLNGMCTAAAATLVCVSGVCDTDNKCGLNNGDGPCTVANGGTVCRSGVCDPDLKCGYAVGDGPCTVANQGTVCRSGACSTNGKCEPAGGCDVDADCTGGNWCNETTHACTPKIANGGPIPTDGPHTSPTLNGTCSAAAATLVCVSGVCDTVDNECGLVNGDGPCTVATGGTVCRSGACDANDMKCGLANGDGPCAGGAQCRSNKCNAQMVCVGCMRDADCATSEVCDTVAGTCKPKPLGGDGGMTGDSGVPTKDSGVPTSDSGVAFNDSGVPANDAGSTPLEDDGSVAGGGLSCSVGSLGMPPSSNALTGFAGLALAIGALARRRRR